MYLCAKKYLKFVVVFSFLLLLSITYLSASVSNYKLPEKVAYIYNQSSNEFNPDSIYRKILIGESTDTLYRKPIKLGTSVWTYIPKNVLKERPSENYFLMGFFNKNLLYEFQNGKWIKVVESGLYMPKSDLSEVRDRFSFRLYSDSNDIADAYLIQSIRTNDYVISQHEARIMTLQSKDEWYQTYRLSKSFLDKIFLILWGIQILCIVTFTARYFLIRDIANLIFALGNLCFILHFIFQYFLAPSNVYQYPFNDYRFMYVGNLPIGIIGLGLIFLSFNFFYSEDSKQTRTIKRTSKVISYYIFSLIAIVFLLNLKFLYLKYIINIFVYISIIFILLFSLILIYSNEKILKDKKDAIPFLIFKNGILSIIVSVIIGFVLAYIFADNTHYYNNYYLLTLPILIGVCSYNVFVVIALIEREALTNYKANQLGFDVAEKESHALQSALNPDFIFNSLKHIDDIIVSLNYKLAQEKLHQFSDLLREVLNYSQEQLIKLSDEIKIITLYLSFEQERDKDLEVAIEVDEILKTEYVKLPTLIVQSNIENLLQLKDLYSGNEPWKISVKFSQEGDKLFTQIIFHSDALKDEQVKTQNNYSSCKKKIYRDIDIFQRSLSKYNDTCVIFIEEFQDDEICISIKTYLDAQVIREMINLEKNASHYV